MNKCKQTKTESGIKGKKKYLREKETIAKKGGSTKIQTGNP